MYTIAQCMMARQALWRLWNPDRPARSPCLLQAALRAKSSGSTRFCMGAAWRGPSQVGARQWQRVLDMVKRIRGLDMEVPGMPDN